MEVSFLTTRVKLPDEYGWGKLKMLLKKLKGTKRMKLKLRVESLSVVGLWIDSSYNTHNNFRGCTGVIMSLVRGDVLI